MSSSCSILCANSCRPSEGLRGDTLADNQLSAMDSADSQIEGDNT